MADMRRTFGQAGNCMQRADNFSRRESILLVSHLLEIRCHLRLRNVDHIQLFRDRIDW
jgi:hypothetical protein